MTTVVWALALLTTALASPRCMAPAQGVIGNGGLDPLCEEGVVKDDGTVETGYGWVPSVVDGRYVQTYDLSEFAGRSLDEVCVCWLRTRSDDVIDFEVQIYQDRNGVPALVPMASFPALAEAVPLGIVGQMYSVDTGGLILPEGTFYIGVAWNPSVDQFFFVCTDTSDPTPPVEVFFIDDRADEWVSVFESSDPIFDDHKAIIVRAVGSRLPSPVIIPTTGGLGLLALSVLLAAVGFLRLAMGRRGRSG